MLRTIGMAAAVAASVGLAVPAEAQWRGGRPYRHHRSGIDGGDVLLGALLAGGVIAVASAASRADRQRRAEPPAEPLPPEWTDPNGPDGNFDGSDLEDGDDTPVAANDEDVAADTCAEAAEEEGRRIARRATVSAITDVDRAGQGWFVAGTIDLSDGYRDAGTPRRFRCNLTVGQAPSVRIDGGVLAQR